MPMMIFFLFLHENICCGYSLEAPQWGGSNECPQHIFLWRNKKNIMWIPPLFIPHPTIVAGYYGFTLVVREFVSLSVRLSIFCFRMITWVNINGFSPNLVCALILWRSGLGLLMGKFRQFLTELSARDTPIFSFPDDNLSKHQWIFTKLGTGICIDIVEIWSGIANGQISSIFDGVICPRHAHIFVSRW